MAHAQPGIFALGTRSHHHLEFDVTRRGPEVLAAVAEACEAADAVAGVNLVVGFGARLWSEIAPGQVPGDFGDFEPVEGPDGFVMPATQHDLWVWLHGAGPDAVFDVARASATTLSAVATVAAEHPCFAYLSSQDLTGFEDGTENPPVHEAVRVATIPDGEPCAGGSVVLLQRWVHDLDRFDTLPLEERERVFGRTLQGSVELDEAHQVPDSHVSRVVIEDANGEELEVFRRSSAFGGVIEHGLVFVALSRDRARLRTMLDRMAGRGDGLRDRLTRFSRPTSGAWYLAPPVELLTGGR
ncbi:MAG TPA: Dyp-type peroxidase [Acidimicrobiales bacterium]|nr:Dyp-type peroxidase [Acidimicrobiales bacterium]